MKILMKHLKLVFSTFLIFISYNAQAASSYEMPVGIPNTTLDFQQEMPARPSDWSAEVPGYYYIDYQNGVKSQAYGTPSAPRKMIPSPAPAGSYIEISGEYTQGFLKKQNRMYTFNGTDDAWSAGVAGPVWITGAKDTYGAISFVGFQMQGSNIFISDLDFINGAKIQVSSSSKGYKAENVLIRNVDISGGGISVVGDATAPVNNVIIYNSKFHDFGDIYSELDEDAHLVSIGAYISNLWILDSLLHTASGAGVQVLGASERGTTNNIYVGNNEVYDVRQSGLWVKSGTNVVFSSNTIRNVISTPWSPSKGMGAQYLPDELWMINNHVSGVEYGIRIASTTGVSWTQKIYAIGNIIHNVRTLQEGSKVGPISNTSSWQSAAIHIAGSHEQYIYNNLIFDAPNGIDSSSPKKTVIKNNIILDVTAEHVNEPTGYHILAEIQELNEEVFIENNYFGDGMHVQVHKGVTNVLHNDVDTLNAEEGASGNIQGTNIITQNNIDSIMDTMSIDGFGFTQLKDAGINVNDILITQFKYQFPSTSGINSDIFDKQRDLGNSIDIGPFEQYGVKQTPTIPTKPGELTLFQLP
ncbi:right-handed parallel beta-helix repeat-containing protein [Psychromonas sp. SA13A]|uniref:right-handed parallel beta-helix repeat-containing protein n=1 Tax=Psychromonas sp. SA13A TaxID=2686346 RepID=UPI001408A883|nr:right-handed parallel beta-helix repeat-containing protein [Psychromonas sp. SA13A]